MQRRPGFPAKLPVPGSPSPKIGALSPTKAASTQVVVAKAMAVQPVLTQAMPPKPAAARSLFPRPLAPQPARGQPGSIQKLTTGGTVVTALNAVAKPGAVRSPVGSAVRAALGMAPAPSSLPRKEAAPSPRAHGVGLDSATVRARMVSKLAEGGISSVKVLDAMRRVERHRFLDSALVNQAYEDTSLPIGLGQTISKPSVVARMVELLLGAEIAQNGRLGRVLEIGTGCGYQAAVLSHVAHEVYSIERLRGLHDKARVYLRPLSLPNVHLIVGDGMLGFAAGAPYAAIISAAGGEAVPPAWIAQLAVGGRLIAPVLQPGGAQALLVIDKTSNGLKQNVLESVHFVPLKSGIA